MVSSTPWPYFTPRKRLGTHCTGGWVGHRVSVYEQKILRHRDFFLKQMVFIFTLVTVEIQLHFLQGQTIHTTQCTNSIAVASMYLSVMVYATELLAW